MAELKGQAADRFVERPDTSHPIVLVHGPDRGRVSMRAQALIKALAGDDPDPMTMVELDAALLETEPARLAEEADSVPMFGGHKVISVRMNDPKALVKPIEALLEAPPQGASIIIAAGDLKKSHPLRSRIEKSTVGVALACYSADARDIGALLGEMVAKRGLSIDQDARMMVIGLLGSDHAMSAAEIEKLCLFSMNDGTITVDHVEALLIDSSMMSLGDVADAAFAGNTPAALSALSRALSEGIEASLVTQSLYRHAALLERLRIEMDNGASADSAMAKARPPVFFKRKPKIIQALSRWGGLKLRNLLHDLDEEIVLTRLDQDLKATRVERQVLRIASTASRAARR